MTSPNQWAQIIAVGIANNGNVDQWSTAEINELLVTRA